MNHGTTKKLTPRELEWIQRQMLKPNPIFLVSELVTLTGSTTNARQLRRWLVAKGVIEKREGERGRVHLVPFSRLKSLWPEFWLSVRAAWSEGGLNRRRVDDDVDDAA